MYSAGFSSDICLVVLRRLGGRQKHLGLITFFPASPMFFALLGVLCVVASLGDWDWVIVVRCCFSWTSWLESDNEKLPCTVEPVAFVSHYLLGPPQLYCIARCDIVLHPCWGPPSIFSANLFVCFSLVRADDSLTLDILLIFHFLPSQWYKIYDMFCKLLALEFQ